MSNPVTLLSTTLPAPTGGLDFFSPLAAMGESNSPWMVNAEGLNRIVRVRNGYRIFSTSIPAPISWMCSYGTGVNEVLYLAVGNLGGGVLRGIYKITQAGVATLDYSDAVSPGAVAMAFKFGSALAFPQDNAESPGINTLFFNQAVGTWAAWTLRYNGINFPVMGISIFYKGRIYGRTSYAALQSFAYGEIAQIQGDIPLENIFPVGQLFYFSGRISFLATFVISNDAQSTEYFAVGNEAGEVLVYSGDNPGADNWNLEARLTIPRPIASHPNVRMGGSVLVYESDTLILTYNGVISLRSAFVGSKAQDTSLASTSISFLISDLWINLVRDIPNISNSHIREYISTAFNEKERQLFFFIPRARDIDGNALADFYTMLIYSIDSKSWAMHQLSNRIFPSPASGNVTYFNGGIYFWTGSSVMRLDSTSWLDQDPSIGGFPNLGYDFAIHSAPTTLEETTATKVVRGLQPLVKQEAPRCGFGVKVSADFGRSESAASTPANTRDLNKLLYSVGAEGTFFQYKIEGNTATTSGIADTSKGLDLYAVNIFYQKGGIL